MNDSAIRTQLTFDGRVRGLSQQRLEVYLRLQAGGVHRADPARVPDDMRRPYRWMQQQAEVRLSQPVSGPLSWLFAYPPAIGASVLCDSSCGGGVPACGRVHPWPGHVQLVVDLAADRVLLSNWGSWDLAVTGLLLTDDLGDRSAFLAALPAPNPHATRRAELYPPFETWPAKLRAEAEASWARVFDLKPLSGDPTRSVQGCVTELRPGDVVDAVVGPPLAQADRWWDYQQAVRPELAVERPDS